jgi:hypothetical protein
MVVLAHLGSQCTKFHAARWMCWFFMSFYLELCIWPDAISRWMQQRNSECASNFVQILDKVQRRSWQWSDKCSGKKAWAVHECLNGTFGSGPVGHLLRKTNTGRIISCTMPDTVAKLPLLMRSEVVMGHAYGFDCLVGHALCRCQICGQDSDSW